MRHNLSEINAIIRDRRTIYPEFFSDRAVHREQIELLLNNAIWAPTHGMTQPWRFKVYMGDARQRLSDYLVQTYTDMAGSDINEMKLNKLRNRPMLASAVIAVRMTPDPRGKIPAQEEYAAVACAIQNMHLTATAHGLGLFWSTPKILREGHHHTFFGYPEEDTLMGLLYIGYPAGEWPKGQRKPIEYVTEWSEA